MSDISTIQRRYGAVCERVRAAAERAGRDPTSAAVIAVTKRHPATVIEAGHAAGIRQVGENYAQELVAKLDEVPSAAALRWHFIGRLQRNKVKYIVGRVALIHTVDSPALAREIAKRAARRADSGELPGGSQRVLVAVNIAGEAQKSGVRPDELDAVLAEIGELDHIDCIGLMTMPPWPENPEDNRHHFRRLRQLRETLQTPTRSLPELSMGTTGDFEVAVEEGATLVRVGTAIFGPRP